MLDREAWVRAGLDALEAGGAEAVAVVPLAAALNVTRGSFYWHFESRDELLRGVLALWEREHSDAVLEAMRAIEDPRERLRALFDRATAKPSSIFVRLLDAAEREPAVRAVLDRSRDNRLAVLEGAYRQCGATPAVARRDALIAYSVYVGLAQILRDRPTALVPREAAALARQLSARLVP
jgi:AcrR family transcriptional regulator